MAKKKKLLKKLAKAALIGGALYGATKLGRRKKVFPETENINIGVGGPQIEDAPWIPKKFQPFDPNPPPTQAAKGGRIGAKGGGIAKRGMGAAFKKGGHVKSMGIAKRGGGVAKR